MAYQRLQVSEGLAVIPSDTVPIPDPATEVISGTADFSVAGTLTDVLTTFLSAGIQTNAIVYNVTAGIAYYITAVTDNLNLALSPSSAGGAADEYVIYNAATKACTLYVGVAGGIIVQMASQRDAANTDTVTFENVPSSSFLPILVTRVAQATVASKIIALW
tara:strand:- start:1428 stop:1913 length:486 start_codon:yes stop_codon:yes gene_type:complete